MRQVERVAKTKAALVDAFWKLYKTKPIDQISVREITDAAGVYRSTFYLYFKDAATVLALLEDELIERLSALLVRIETKSSLADIPSIMALFYKKEGSYLYPLLGPQGDHRFSERVINLIRPTVEAASTLDAQAFDMVFRFYCAATIGLMSDCYPHRRKVSLDKVADTARKLIIDPEKPQEQLGKQDIADLAPAENSIEAAGEQTDSGKQAEQQTEPDIQPEPKSKKTTKPKRAAKPKPNPELVKPEDDDIQMALF